MPSPAARQPRTARSAAQARVRVTAALAFARCLRGRGFPRFPDPTSTGELSHEMLASAGIDMHQPALLRAADACVERDPRRDHQGRRGALRGGAMKVAVLALAALVAGCGGTPGRSSDRVAPTSVATVTTRTLSETTPVSGKLGYAGGYTVLGGLSGSDHRAARGGAGDPQRPGALPRRRRAGDAAVRVHPGVPRARRGRDRHGRVASSTATWWPSATRAAADLDPSSDEFGWATGWASSSCRTTSACSRPACSRSATVVFLPTAARVTDVRGALGGPAGGAVLSATSTAREVSVDLDAGLQSQVKRGDRVSITLPDSRTTPGRVSSVGTVATAGSSPTVPVRIALTRPARRRPPRPGARRGGDHRPDRARRAGGAGGRAAGAGRRPLRRRGRRPAPRW